MSVSPVAGSWSLLARACLLALVAAWVDCRRATPPDRRDAVPDASRSGEAPLTMPEPVAPRCAQRIDSLIAGRPFRSRGPEARAAMLVSAKGEPVLFVRPPEAGGLDAFESAYRRRFRTTLYPRDVLGRWLGLFSQNPTLGRATLLTEGYLFADEPDQGHALVDLLQAHHLYREPRIWVQRGEQLIVAERKPWGRYFVTEGEERGKPLRLLLYDRVGVGEPPAPLHRDFRELRYRLHFDRARVRFADERRVVAELRYGRHWVPTLLESDGARLSVDCEATSASESEAVKAAREANRVRAAAIQALRQAVLEQVDEAIFFDEPMTEIGQQDGRLRPVWRFAYLAGRNGYRFMGDRYPVFDRKGRPLPPQVCIDFLLDTWERASGTWWRPAGEPRGRTRGLWDWDDHGGFALRPAAHFIEFAESRPDWFDVLEPAPSDSFGIGNLRRLGRYLVDHADDYEPGDMVLIHGWTPWDRHERHYHSFFVYETDPLTGVPIVIADNAGRPSLRTWRVESTRTPDRVIVRRFRPRTEWLRLVVPADAPVPSVPPPLGAAPQSPLPAVIPGRR